MATGTGNKRDEILAAARELSLCADIFSQCGDSQEYAETIEAAEAALQRLRAL